jgi:putative phosphoribosyl transferase
VLGELVALCGDLVRPVVVALPRGGVPVAAEVARRLGAPLVVMPVGKVSAPGQDELALGAVAPGGVRVMNQGVLAAFGLDDAEIEHLVSKATAKVVDQSRSYNRGPQLSLLGRSVVVVDDGLATGATMWAALMAVRAQHPERLVLAVPVAPPEALAALAPLVDQSVCPVQPSHMEAVGAWYEDFTQTTDAEVAAILAELSSA